MFATPHASGFNKALMPQLQSCLEELDRLGEHVAAAHLSACIETLTDQSDMDTEESISD
ncbi:hypothetical protein GTZ99_07105 [Novosphingobium sp. FSY-8]|uniref:Rop-like protein n=1 Tax=Novosphingobium ovatum TaxID=1908523 RepID=A0ABW9XCR7_9SPHN|nr:hypothetical protein [Novosphingobium ovatum]NBC36324.1 hypothetical protein [Novosphingobium ovatum]